MEKIGVLYCEAPRVIYVGGGWGKKRWKKGEGVLYWDSPCDLWNIGVLCLDFPCVIYGGDK